MTLLLIFLFGAMAISFLCSLLESVLMSTPISFISAKVEEGDKNAKLMEKMKDDIDRPIAAILSLNTIANTLGAAGVGRQATIVFGSEWFGLVSAIMTILILVFSEIIPKTIGTSNWKHLLWLSRIMNGLIYIMYPLVILVQFITKLVAKDAEDEETFSREEVAAMANIGEEEGVIDKSENKVIQNIIKLDDIKAYDVFAPEVLQMIDELGDELLDKVPYADSITSLMELSLPIGTEDGFEVKSPFEDGVPSDPRELAEKKAFILSRESLLNNLVSADCRETWLIVNLEQYSENLDEAMKKIAPPAKSFPTRSTKRKSPSSRSALAESL